MLLRRRRSPFTAVLVGLLSALVVFLVVIQVRSQAEVARTLAGEDPTTLAFLIDDLHSANDALAAEVTSVQGQADALRRGGGSGAQTELVSEIKQMQAIDGLVPVHGPGVIVSIDASLTAVDLEDALNNLRISGAEAITVNGRRVVTATPIVDQGSRVLVGGYSEGRPWTIVAVGDPQQLASAADLMTKNLQSDPRVTLASWRAVADVTISAVLPQRPFVYGSPG
jgi:uncharacterized protein YlxW (UPF0749 family)